MPGLRILLDFLDPRAGTDSTNRRALAAGRAKSAALRVYSEQCEKPGFPGKNHALHMARGLRQLCRKNAFGHHIVSLNGITASAISALQTNQAALNVVSNNVANLNTPGYARRVVNEQTLSADGQLTGVDIATVERVTNQFLQQEQLAAGGYGLAV